MVLYKGLIFLELTIKYIMLIPLYLSCELHKVQARLTDVLGLHHTSSKVSISSNASFAENTNTRKAYKQFCKNLYHIGVTEDMIIQKEKEILDILKSQSSSMIGGSNIVDQGKLLGCCNLFTYIQLLTYQQIVMPTLPK